MQIHTEFREIPRNSAEFQEKSTKKILRNSVCFSKNSAGSEKSTSVDTLPLCEKKAIEDWPLPTVHDSGEVGVTCTFNNVLQLLELPEARS
jgi:hypothetical protein